MTLDCKFTCLFIYFDTLFLLLLNRRILIHKNELGEIETIKNHKLSSVCSVHPTSPCMKRINLLRLHSMYSLINKHDITSILVVYWSM